MVRGLPASERPEDYRLVLSNPVWQEVAAFTRSNFKPELCGAMDERVLQDFDRYPDAATFYRETEIYLYHGPAFFLEGIKRPYYAVLMTLLANKAAMILDYGCGTGDDGLLFAALGLNVSLADLPSRSLDFAKWRALRRGHYLFFFELGKDDIPLHDVVWCCDVLEHLPPEDQPGFIDELCRHGATVIVNLVNDPAADGQVHHPVDVEALTLHARTLAPVWWSDYYDGRTRLLVIGAGADQLPVITKKE